MGKLSLSEGFSVIPEGTYVFKIVKVDYKEAYGKLEITMKTAKGQQYTERFSLLKPDGSSNEGALNAFSYFAKTALNDYGVEEIDPQDLVGHFMECDVEHDLVPSTKDPKKTLTFARLSDKRPSEGFAEPAQKPAPSTASKSGYPDIDALLG